MGIFFVLRNFTKLSHQLDILRLISQKFSIYYLYEKWIEHPNLAVPYSYIVSIVTEFENKKGQNYQIFLKRVFGAK